MTFRIQFCAPCRTFAHSSLTSATPRRQPGTTSNKWREAYAYDRNGNIESLVRYDAALILDSLVYNYNTGKNQLNWIRGKAGATPYALDLEPQSANNYDYDKSGFLTRDVKEKMTPDGSITWTADGKLKSVAKVITNGTRNFDYKYDAMRNRVVAISKKTLNSVVQPDTLTYYIRDAQGNTMATYSRVSNATTLTWQEAHIYGSSRLGMHQPKLQVHPRPATNPNHTTTASQQQLQEGWKRYELTNHLGNVLSVITDRKLGVDSDANGAIDKYSPEIIAAQDYYPFGMQMPGREAPVTNSYRYGFNGKEEDDEVKGDGNSVDFGARMDDPRVGRWLSVDPLQSKYPGISPYAYVANNPIHYIDPDGRLIILSGSKEEVKKMANHLMVIAATEKGRAYIDLLNNSTTVYRIQDAGWFSDEQYEEQNKRTLTYDVDKGVSINDNSTRGDEAPYLTLFHEIQHLVDDESNYYQDRHEAEYRAMENENYGRLVFGFKNLRTLYEMSWWESDITQKTAAEKNPEGESINRNSIQFSEIEFESESSTKATFGGQYLFSIFRGKGDETKNKCTFTRKACEGAEPQEESLIIDIQPYIR